MMSTISLFCLVLCCFCCCFIVVGQPVYGAYGTAENGQISGKIFMLFGSLGEELEIREASMCQGAAWYTISWNEDNNTVVIKLRMFGLPYRPTLCYSYNPSNSYNTWPYPCVSNGKWQLWIVPHLFDYPTVYYYTSAGILIGNEYDLGGLSTPPPGAINITVPATIQLGSPFFESDPSTLQVSQQFMMNYDELLDSQGNAGTVAGIVLSNLSNPASLIVHYTDYADLIKPIPTFSWGDVLTGINNNVSFTIASSYEPFPKPTYLKSRDNTMIGWTAQWGRFAVPSVAQPLNPNNQTCGTAQWPAPGNFLI